MANRGNSDEIVLSCPPRWVWLLAGIAIGIFVSILFYIQMLAPGTQSTSIQDAPSTAQSPETVPANNNADVKNTKVAEESQSDESRIREPGRYLLEVGSFSDEQNANGMKDYLVSLDIPAKVEQTNLGEEGRWYQVQVGPLSDLDKLNEIRDKLAANNISAKIRKF
ncbi:MAG: SPOR domain-containing protein [Pseudomonadota bacterium]